MDSKTKGALIGGVVGASTALLLTYLLAKAIHSGDNKEYDGS